MFRSNGGVVQSRRDGMGQFYLSFFVREQKRFRSLKNTEPSALKSRGMLATTNSFTACFNAYHSNLSVLQEGMEQTNRIAAAADTGDEQIGRAFFALENLATRFDADDTLKIAD